MVAARNSRSIPASGAGEVAKSAERSYVGQTAFHTQVYEACCKIPKGKVATYKTLAMSIGKPKAFRAVGTALKKNPYAPEVPCHRVVASDLTLGGFQGATDHSSACLKKKRRMLEEEGVQFAEHKVQASCCHAF